MQEAYAFCVRLVLPPGFEPPNIDHDLLMRLLCQVYQGPVESAPLGRILQAALAASPSTLPSTQRLLAVLTGAGSSAAAAAGSIPLQEFGDLAAAAKAEMEDLTLQVGVAGREPQGVPAATLQVWAENRAPCPCAALCLQLAKETCSPMATEDESTAPWRHATRGVSALEEAGELATPAPPAKKIRMDNKWTPEVGS